MRLYNRQQEHWDAVRDHVAYCRKRARPLLDAGDLEGALDLFVSDMNRNKRTKDRGGVALRYALDAARKGDADGVNLFIFGGYP